MTVPEGGTGGTPPAGTRLEVTAPVPGTVVLVPVAVGTPVADGGPLLVLESM